MIVSYSKVGTFVQCPYKFKLNYIDGLKTYPNLDDPANALYLGSALHKGIEVDVETAIKEYYDTFPIVTDLHFIEAIKLEYRIKQCKEILPEGLHEVKVQANGDYIGFIDLLVPVGKDEYDLYDFKYSNNVNGYLESQQLHVYKHYFEKVNPKKHIRNLYYLFVPKVQIRQKKTESLDEFRARVRAKLTEESPQIVQVPYDVNKVKEFLRNAKECRMATNYPKQPSRFCDWCEYQKYCESDEKEDLDIMNLPKNERQSATSTTNRKIWIYGLPFSGKTYLANQFPDILLLSTDGNYKRLPDGIPPHIDIKDIVEVDGRITKRTLAWDVFKDTIDELEKKQNDFKTIVVDLLEDTYEHCRLYCYNKLGIEHESDNSFKAWDYVKTEFLSTIKRLMALDYENIILISHEDTSKDLTKKSGDKITAIKPNLQEKASLKIAGMVDVVIRVVNDDGNRVISFKSNEVTFGGGRMTVDKNEIPCTYEDLIGIYKDTKPKAEKPKAEKPKVETAEAKPTEVETPEDKPRTRKLRGVVERPEITTPLKDDVELTNGTETIKLRSGVDTLEYMMELVGKGYKAVEVEEETPRRRRRRTEE